MTNERFEVALDAFKGREENCIVALEAAISALDAYDAERGVSSPTKDLATAEALLRHILAADERGQGTPFAEAMDAAKKFVDGRERPGEAPAAGALAALADPRLTTIAAWHDLPSRAFSDDRGKVIDAGIGAVHSILTDLLAHHQRVQAAARAWVDGKGLMAGVVRALAGDPP